MKRKNYFWDVFFAASYPLMFGCLFLVSYLKKIDGGSALGGKIENGYFNVISDKGEFHIVGSLEWYFNLVISCLMLISGLVAGCGFVYFLVKYYFHPLFKSNRKGNML